MAIEKNFSLENLIIVERQRKAGHEVEEQQRQRQSLIIDLDQIMVIGTRHHHVHHVPNTFYLPSKTTSGPTCVF